VHVDVRSDGVLIATASDVPYVVAVDDCSQLTSISLGSGANDNHSVSETIPTDALGCELHVHRTGSDRLTPAVNLHFSDDKTQSHSEVFQSENIAPTERLRRRDRERAGLHRFAGQSDPQLGADRPKHGD
jgi:hypothetical protein